VSLEVARELAESGELDQAWKYCDEALKKNPDDPRALILSSFIMEKCGRNSIGYQLSKRVTQLFPMQPVGWINLGRCADNMWRMDEALECYKNAEKLSKEKDLKKTVALNISAVYLQLGKFEEAKKYALEALEYETGNRKATHNLGLCQLANHEWREGWKNYHASLGSGNRKMFQYADEPEWDGSPDKRIVIYGEQGIGDEICAASMFNDAISRSKSVVIDCDSRLANLFRRSFPSAKVYGTRTKDVLDWDEEDLEIDASIASMQLGQYFRNTDESFTGKPYLKADPDRVAMWKGLWATKGKPVIGVAWSGGIESTGSNHRKWSVSELNEILSKKDAHYVCLQYKPEDLSGFTVDIKQYPYGTLTKDYDDTAALVASLDIVFSMQTSVIHLAGSLGVPTYCGVPEITQWRYGSHGDAMPWYNSVKIFRQKNGKWSWPDL
jgi:tetratricopeptide (TPR) repeat protein